MNILVIEKIGFDTNILLDSLKNVNNKEEIDLTLSNNITNSLKLLSIEVFDVILLNPIILSPDVENNLKIFLNYNIPIVLLVENNYNLDEISIIDKIDINRIFIKGHFQVNDLSNVINNISINNYDCKKYIEKITSFREKQNKAFVILNSLSNNLNSFAKQISKEQYI